MNSAPSPESSAAREAARRPAGTSAGGQFGVQPRNEAADVVLDAATTPHAAVSIPDDADHCWGVRAFIPDGGLDNDGVRDILRDIDGADRSGDFRVTVGEDDHRTHSRDEYEPSTGPLLVFERYTRNQVGSGLEPDAADHDEERDRLREAVAKAYDAYDNLQSYGCVTHGSDVSAAHNCEECDDYLLAAECADADEFAARYAGVARVQTHTLHGFVQGDSLEVHAICRDAEDARREYDTLHEFNQSRLHTNARVVLERISDGTSFYADTADYGCSVDYATQQASYRALVEDLVLEADHTYDASVAKADAMTEIRAGLTAAFDGDEALAAHAERTLMAITQRGLANGESVREIQANLGERLREQAEMERRMGEWLIEGMKSGDPDAIALKKALGRAVWENVNDKRS